jgi:hypothetical protein
MLLIQMKRQLVGWSWLVQEAWLSNVFSARRAVGVWCFVTALLP